MTIEIQQPALDLQLEQFVLSALLANPDLIEQATNRLVETDFDHAVHQHLFGHLAAIQADGRRYSIIEVARILGEGEIEAGLTGPDYCDQLLNEGAFADKKSLRRYIDSMLDRRNRRVMAAIGSRLMQIEMSTTSVADTAADAVSDLDEIRASLRPGKVMTYDAEGASASAIEAMSRDGTNSPTTGITSLDTMIGGWPRGQLTIVAARPGMGKSALATCAARSAAKSGSGVLMFSLEMTREQMGARLLADECFTSAEEPVNYEGITNQTYRGNDRVLARLKAAQKRITGMPLRIEERRGVSASEIVSRVSKVAADYERKGHKLETVIVDHIGLVRASKRYAGQRYREVAEITDALATVAKDHDIAVVGLCQLNRGVEGRDNKRPTLSDLRDSGSIEEDASCVIFLYRPAYYLELQGVQDDHEKEMARQAALQAQSNTLELGIAKNRNGRSGMLGVYVNIGANAIRPISYAKTRR